MSRKNGIIYCNRCGKEICMEDWKDRTSFLAIRKEWGYFSDKKDGMIHSMDICEESLVIPPEEKKMTEFV